MAASTDVLCWTGSVPGRPGLLAPEGTMLVVHSAVCDDTVTLRRFTDVGLQADVLARCTIPFGPVMRLRAAMLEARGLIEPGQRDEELVVIAARGPAGAQRVN